jgi:hypothetical protein
MSQSLDLLGPSEIVSKETKSNRVLAGNFMNVFSRDSEQFQQSPSNINIQANDTY